MEKSTDKIHQKADNGSMIDANIAKNQQIESNFSEKDSNIAQNQPQSCKNKSIFDNNSSNVCDSNKYKPDPVSELEFNHNVENQTDNLRDIYENDEDSLFSRLFPGVKRENVENNRLFKLFASGKGDERSFVAIYSDFVSFVNEISENIRIKALYGEKSKSVAVGALSTTESPNSGFFTKEQVMRMSREQIAENYEKIRKSQSRW